MALRGASSSGAMPIIVTGGDTLGNVKTARISGGTGTIQWARYNATTGAYISDIVGQTGTTYNIQLADVGFIVGAYLTNYQPFSHGTTAASISDVLPTPPTGSILSDFTTASRSLPGGMTDDSSDPPVGKSSTVTGFVAPAASINMRPLDIGASAFDLRGGLVSVTFKIRPTGTLARTQLNLANCFVNLYNDSNPAAAKTNYLRVSFLGGIQSGEIANGEWQTLRLPIEIFTAVGTVPDIQAYLQTVRYAGIEFGHNSTNSDAYRVSVDFSNSFANPITKGMVVIGFDDCRRDTYAYAYPKMDAFGLVGTLYPGAINACLDLNDSVFMNTSNVLELQSKGWQVAFQAYNTENPQMNATDFAANEVTPLKALYVTKGFNGHQDGSYFSNVGFGSQYQSVFDANFRTMRGFKTFTDGPSGNPSSFPRPETLPPSNTRELRAYGVDTFNNSFTDGLALFIARAAARKSVAIIVFHATGAGDRKHTVDGGVLTTFEKTMEYLNSTAGRAAVDVVTWSEAVRRWQIGA